MPASVTVRTCSKYRAKVHPLSRECRVAAGILDVDAARRAFHSAISPANSPTLSRAAIALDISEFADALVKLGDLRDSGLLTDEEFAEQKQRLLGH